jgi:hypothetical protein
MLASEVATRTRSRAHPYRLFSAVIFPSSSTTYHAKSPRRLSWASSWVGQAGLSCSSRFPLAGAHVAAACRSCHSTLVFDQVPEGCASCHTGDFEQAREPDHQVLPTTCDSCHSPDGWSPATFDHGPTTFTLDGIHRTADCASCHIDGYAGTPSDCFSCHESDYNGASNPDHQDSHARSDLPRNMIVVVKRYHRRS